MLDFSIKIKLRGLNEPHNLNFVLPRIISRVCNSSKIEDPDEKFFINFEERKVLADFKNKINDKNTNKDWDKAKKLTNLYELIHISNNKMKGESISRYDPLSRSFFKLWEIINHFSLINIRNPIVSGHLAEGPGGFVEACLYYRQRIIKIYPLLDKYYGITLNSHSREIPGWGKANSLIRKFKKNIEIDYGVDNTGDLYKVHNIRSFSTLLKKISHGADLLTADGGFDFSVDFNKQEPMAHRLLLAELLTGIKSQKIGGHFICKLFDSYSYLTIQLMYFMSCLYNEVYFVKPLTSRPANSEKYMVALSFKGFKNKTEEYYYISNLEDILDKWDNIHSNGLIIKSIFENPPKWFIERIKEYNSKSFEQQTIYIQKTLEIIDNKPNWKDLEIIIDYQTEKSIEWCCNYHLSINLESYFYQKYQLKRNCQKSEKKYKEYILELDKYFENFIGYKNIIKLE